MCYLHYLINYKKLYLLSIIPIGEDGSTTTKHTIG